MAGCKVIGEVEVDEVRLRLSVFSAKDQPLV